MEVTKKNFHKVLEELKTVIPSALFLAIDGEFTGLHNGQDVNAFDTPMQYYKKLHSGSMDFLLIQFGLCVFNYDKEEDKYCYRAYNFYIFPYSRGKSMPDSRFLCQSSSIEFLTSQGFDFNKLFKEGIPYLTQPEEQRLRDNLMEKQKTRSNMNNSSPGNEENSTIIPIPEEYVATIEDVCSRIEEFLEDKEKEEMQVDRCNAFVRKLIFQTVSQRFDKNLLHLETIQTENRNRVLVVTRLEGEEERLKKEERKREMEKKELEEAIGFSSLIRLITKSGKLVVGHNMLLDVCHVIHQCCFPLPDNYDEFKELLHCAFPKLLDTKFLSSSPKFKAYISSTVLEHLYKTLSEDPFTMCEPELEDKKYGYSAKQEKYHEAAYDAYITGLCFITMAKHISSVQKSTKEGFPASCAMLDPYINKLFLVRVQDNPYINVVGDDPVPSRDHVFHVTFPSEWKISDIVQLFSPFGAVFVAWLNETSAYVSLYNRDQASIVQKILTQNDTFTLMTYAAHQKLLECKNGKSLPKQIVPSSPTTNIRKRRSLEALQDDVEDVATAQTKRRSRSFGDKTTFSKRVIDPIPEEQETDEVEHNKESDSQARSKCKSSSPAIKKKVKKQFEESDTWD